jgi:hypothetical protein
LDALDAENDDAEDDEDAALEVLDPMLESTSAAMRKWCLTPADLDLLTK